MHVSPVALPAAFAAIALLSGCGSADAPTTNIAVPDNGYTARIEGLTDAQRQGVLLRAIRDAGRDCQGVTAATAAGEVKGAPAWLATCTDGGQWVVALGGDGVATVTNARELAGARQ